MNDRGERLGDRRVVRVMHSISVKYVLLQKPSSKPSLVFSAPLLPVYCG